MGGVKVNELFGGEPANTLSFGIGQKPGSKGGSDGGGGGDSGGGGFGLPKLPNPFGDK